MQVPPDLPTYSFVMGTFKLNSLKLALSDQIFAHTYL
jgi:hypothetical protein